MQGLIDRGPRAGTNRHTHRLLGAAIRRRYRCMGDGADRRLLPGTNVTGSYTVTVSGTQEASGLRFEEGTFTLSGGALTLSGATPTLTLGSGTGTGTVNANLATPMTAANEVLFNRGNNGIAQYNITAANTFSGGLRMGTFTRHNANAVGALGSGTITMEGTESAITNTLNASSFTYSNNIVLNPLNTAGFVAGFAGAGGTAANFATAHFSGNISGNADVYTSATPQLSNTNTNGNGITIFSGNKILMIGENRAGVDQIITFARCD